MIRSDKIHVLNQETINQIAAGEVIERPASVVKELLENAIDAGADAVTVEIKEGGISYIRITDNGCGIPASEIRRAFLRHATSKIETSADLNNVRSLGFRGEALSSIAAVAQVELITKTADELIGSCYRIEGGEERSLEEIGAPTGTTLLVRNLFFHTPVRRKFLKTAQTEGAYVSELVERIALSHPEVSFRLVVNGQTKISTKGNDNLRDLIYAVYGREIAAGLIEIHEENEYFRVDGYIGKPMIARGNRSMENYFVNGRYIRSKVISKAIEDGYKSYLMQHRYPFTVLHFQIRSDTLDVNVHPTKMELRISEEDKLYRALYYVIVNALSGKEYIPSVDFNTPDQKAGTEPEENRGQPEPFERQRRQVEMIKQDAAAPSDQQPAVVREVAVYGKGESLTHMTEKPSGPAYSEKTKTPEEAGKPPVNSAAVQETLFTHKIISPEARVHYQIIGQVFKTYWIFEYDGKMFIMDQHAAHEKVLFERNMKAFRERTMYSQMLCPQQIITLTDKQALAFSRMEAALKEFGYEINEFGGNEYAVRAIPAGLPDMDVYAFLTELLDSVNGEITTASVSQDLYDRIALMSCKAAVKGNNVLSTEEANALLDELMTLENPYMCPHGRPTVISMTQTELDRKFKRIV